MMVWNDLVRLNRMRQAVTGKGQPRRAEYVPG